MCSTIHHNLQDITKTSDNVWNSTTSNIDNGFAIRICAKKCSVICSICNEKRVPHVIDENENHCCLTCDYHYSVENITHLAFVIDLTDRRWARRDIRNIYNSGLFEIVIPITVNYDNPQFEHLDHSIIRRKTKESVKYRNIRTQFIM